MAVELNGNDEAIREVLETRQLSRLSAFPTIIFTPATLNMATNLCIRTEHERLKIPAKKRD
jgi:hypothetical protein